jgi:hypothetical protein
MYDLMAIGREFPHYHPAHTVESAGGGFWVVLFMYTVFSIYLCASAKRWVRSIGYVMAVPAVVLILLLIAGFLQRNFF